MAKAEAKNTSKLYCILCNFYNKENIYCKKFTDKKQVLSDALPNPAHLIFLATDKKSKKTDQSRLTVDKKDGKKDKKGGVRLRATTALWDSTDILIESFTTQNVN